MSRSGYVRTVILECGHDAVFNPEPALFDQVWCRRCADYQVVTMFRDYVAKPKYQRKPRLGAATTVTRS